MDTASELEQPIFDDPYDPASYAIYADWLEEQGDPRGQWIALEVAAEKNRALTAAANEHFERHHDRFVGRQLAEYQQDFTWRFGFIHRLRLASNRAKEYEAVRKHPSGRFLAELFVQPGHFADPDLEKLVELLVADTPRTLRKLQLGATRDTEHEHNWFFSGTYVERLWGKMPRLRHLVVDGGQFRIGDVELPSVEYAAFRTGGLQAVNARSIARAKLPRLRTLHVGGDHNNSTETLFVRGGRVTVSRCDGSFSDIAPLLERTDLPQLRALAITHCLFTDDVCRALPKSPLVGQLDVLDLSWGCMTDAGAALLAANASAFRKLEVLDVSRNYISPRGVTLLGKLARTVRVSHQRPDERRP